MDEGDYSRRLHTQVLYDKQSVIRALQATEIPWSEEERMRLGKESFHNLYNFKLEEGFDLTKEKVPQRLMEAETHAGRLDP